MSSRAARGWVESFASLSGRQERSGELYLEFLRRPALSAGLYALASGARDPQTPHHEDEVYVVLEGRAQLRIDDRDHPVEPGTVAFVAAEVPHRFHSVSEPLRVVVIFAPEETLDPAPGPPPAPGSTGRSADPSGRTSRPRKGPRSRARMRPTAVANYDSGGPVGG